jgi:hypothetical protein
MVVRNLLILLISMMMGGLIAVHFGKELNWDLANYHFYNPFYFLHKRWLIDYWPTTFIHVHLTPTLDFLTYFLIQYVPTKMAVFMLGAVHGINLCLLFCIARLILSTLPRMRYLNLTAFSTALLGLYGPTVLPGIGSFQHDNLVSLFVLAFVLLHMQCLLLYAREGRWAYPRFFLASVLLGVGVGCKLTAGIFVGAALLSFLFLSMPWRQRFVLLLVFCLGVVTGLLLSSGYWMLFLWQTYHSPFFPLWNGIFQSPDFPPYNWHDQRFLPKGWLEALFYPFYFSLDGRTADTPFRDFRFALVYALFLIYALVSLKKWRDKDCLSTAMPSDTQAMWRWLSLFFIFSYILWQSYFSIMRYIAVLEMLAPLMIFLLIDRLIYDALLRFATVLLAFLFMAGTMLPSSMVRAPWYEGSYFNVTLPAFVQETKQATVLVAFPAFAINTFPRPQTYLIPFFPPEWRFVGISFLRHDYTVPHALPALAKSQQTLYLLGSPEYIPMLYHIAEKLDFRVRQACYAINSDRQAMTHEAMLLCAVKK